MNRLSFLWVALAVIPFLGGCQAIGEKEAQMEFEKLRRHSLPAKGDPVLPDFGTQPSTGEAFRFGHEPHFLDAIQVPPRRG